MPFGADIFGDETKSAFGRRRAGLGERIGQKNADPLMGRQGAHGVTKSIMSNGIGSDKQFEGEQPRG